MKIIVTKQNANGSFDEVGMDNRALFSDYKTVRNAMKFAVKPFANGKACRVEIYPSGNIYTKCNWVVYFDAQFNRIYGGALNMKLHKLLDNSLFVWCIISGLYLLVSFLLQLSK